MPRPNPLRTIESEENVARRVAYERERRGWTYEGLAKRMTDAGCPIQGSAIYKVEKGRPRRRVTVDELVAFAQVFEVEVQDLIRPVGFAADREAAGLVTAWINTQKRDRQGGAARRRVGRAHGGAGAHGGPARVPIYEVINNGLFRAVRKAQDDALASFEVFRYGQEEGAES